MLRRLLIIAERFPPDLGGVARSAERIARMIAQSGVDCHVLTWTKTQPPGSLESTLANCGSQKQACKIHRFGLFSNFDFSLQHTLNVVQWLHERHAFDAVWGHYLYPSGFSAVMLAKSLGISSAVSARGNDVDRLMFPPGDFARLEWTLRSADLVTAVSQDLARKIVIIAGNRVAPRVIHNAVDPEAFKPMPAATH